MENDAIINLRLHDQLTEENARLSKEFDKLQSTLEETVHKFKYVVILHATGNFTMID